MRYATSEARDWVRQNLRGYVVTMTTPFLADGEVDVAGIRHNVEHVLAVPGAAGIYVGSIYQEFWTLTEDERKLVTATVVEAVDGRVPVIAGCTHTSSRTVIDLARHAEAAGADLVMIWPPYYGVRSHDGVRQFYEEVAAAVDIGIVIYSTTLPELGFYITPELAEELLEIDNICAIKDATLTLSRYTDMYEAVGSRIAVSCPLEEYYLYAVTAFGFDIVPHLVLGSSRPLYCQTAERPHCADFFEAVERGDLESARGSLRSILKISQPIHSRYLARGHHNIGLTKYINGLMGMAGGPVRPPSSEPTDAERESARLVLVENGIVAPRPGDPEPLVGAAAGVS
jgi:4-hydroxy-tetrahydrodipicolinate synthase